MKKWFIGLLAILIISLAAVYIYIPGNIIIADTAIVGCKINYVNRYLLNQNEWSKWWPGKASGGPTGSLPQDTSFKYNGYAYHISNHYYHKVDIITTDGGTLSSPGFITLLDMNNGSVAIHWQENISTGLNPVNRIRNYQFAKSIKNNMTGILSHASEFLNRKQNIYAADIREVVIKDTAMISLTSVFPHQPGMNEVYRAIGKVRQYISSKGAKETNYPMLSIRYAANEGHIMMVAVPTDKVLDGDDKFKLKRMPVTRILETEIKGGPSTIQSAFSQLQNYSNDYQLGSSALPFESLVTNRIDEPDTTKWVTRLYFPIY